jgi:5'(3')-deoxyribonucleotidase
MITIILLTAATLVLFTYCLYPKAKGGKNSTQILQDDRQSEDKEMTEQAEPVQQAMKIAVKRNDSHLRRVSISTNQTLFDSQFNFIPSMAELLPVLSSKYRLYLITQVPSDGSAEHLKAQMLLKSQPDISSHRIMFCSTSKGKESIVRQLSAEMHIDSDALFCQNLQRFLSKFHLLSEDPQSDQIQKDSNGKIVWFRGVEAYCNKLI